MKWYVARRFLWAIFVTYIILSVTWGLLVLTPNQEKAQLRFQVASSGDDPSVVDAVGPDDPLWERYTNYMTNMMTFNWGWSESRSQFMIPALMDVLPYSMAYGVPATILTTVLGLLLGLYSATHQYTLSDYVTQFFGFFGFAIPNFWFAIILLLIFGVYLEWVPVVFQTSVSFFSFAMVKQLILPVVVLTTGGIAGLLRYSRSTALEYVEAEFVKTARAKGADEWRVLFKHILRPAAVPLATILITDILGIFLAASYLIEVVFGIPGLGTLSYLGIIAQDTTIVLVTTLIFTFIAVIGNLLQDIAYTVLDPRIDYGDR